MWKRHIYESSVYMWKRRIHMEAAYTHGSNVYVCGSKVLHTGYGLCEQLVSVLDAALRVKRTSGAYFPALTVREE